jgi:hypothetical protein
MNLGEGLLLARDVITLLEHNGILLLDGTFDQTKLDSIQEDVEFAASVEGVLKIHGLDVPAKVDRVIALLPLVAGLVD